jgi:hypothetical protein
MNEEFEVLSRKTVKYLNDSTIVSRMAHWTIVGQDFYSFHLMTERTYSELAELMDPLVEQLRAVGFMPTFELFKGPGIELTDYDCHSLGELVLDYLLALDGVIGLFYVFCEEHKRDPRLVGVGNQLQGMSSTVLTLIYLLQSYLA